MIREIWVYGSSQAYLNGFVLYLDTPENRLIGHHGHHRIGDLCRLVRQQDEREHTPECHQNGHCDDQKDVTNFCSRCRSSVPLARVSQWIHVYLKLIS